jgi:hypothetical protein
LIFFCFIPKNGTFFARGQIYQEIMWVPVISSSFKHLHGIEEFSHLSMELHLLNKF